jgi:osmotically-inducible protein OsmY
MKTDTEIRKDVEAELEWDPSIDAAAVAVTVKGGIVTLGGRLTSLSQKLAAEAAAQRVAGVKGVAVEIDVALPGSSMRTDAEIAATAGEALRWNNFAPGEQIRVMVEKGVLTLSGDVGWAYQRKAAEEAVRHLCGVRDVVNTVRIVRQATPRNVQAKIEAALKRAAHVEAQAIQVKVDDGDVVLEGHVPSLAVRQAVTDAAWAAPGVRSVVQHLVVDP